MAHDEELIRAHISTLAELEARQKATEDKMSKIETTIDFMNKDIRSIHGKIPEIKEAVSSINSKIDIALVQTNNRIEDKGKFSGKDILVFIAAFIAATGSLIPIIEKFLK